MSAAGDLYTKILARAVADTASGGLYDTAKGTAFLFGGMFRHEDADNESQAWPRITVQISDSLRPYFGSGNDGLKMRVDFRIYTDKSLQFTAPDAIVQRLLVRYHRWQPSTATDWNWSPMLMRASAQQGVIREKDIVTLVPFTVTARRL